MATFVSGFSLGFSLILAIGAQNAFVLKQGIKKQHVFTIVIISAVSDAILIACGVAGFGAIVNKWSQVEILARYGGALFLVIYAFYSFKSAFTLSHALTSNSDVKTSKYKVVLTCLGFIWLNPHVYLDTVVLLGSISTQYHPNQLIFALGAICSSFTFFFLLGFGARLLAPVFKKPIAWKVLEFLIGMLMLLIAVSLVI